METYGENSQNDRFDTKIIFLDSYQKIHYLLEQFANSRTLKDPEKDKLIHQVINELNKLGITPAQENPIIILERMKEKYAEHQ